MIQISPETQLFIREHSSDDVRTLALQAKKYPDINMPTAITQIAGRQVAAEKIPSWREIEEIWYPKHLSLEQCSSESRCLPQHCRSLPRPETASQQSSLYLRYFY